MSSLEDENNRLRPIMTKPIPKLERRNTNSVQYQLKQVVGKGSYGIVYRAINRKTKVIVAIKEINYENDNELNESMIEIDLLKNLDHINIIKYHGFIQKMSSLYIILEYAAHGSLKSLMSKRPEKCLTDIETRVYIRQTLHGLIYLHEQGVIHRDIKAANLLLDGNNVVKLADFGVSTKVNNTAMTLAGSLNWMAPEIITNKGASTLSDIWSLGATVIELVTGNPPFHNLMDINIYYAIENDTYFPPDSLPFLCKKFLDRCFQKNMFKRPSAKELLNDAWLDSVPNAVPKATVKSGSLDIKLLKFKENNEDMSRNWDEDFKEDDIHLDSIKVKQFKSPKSASASPTKSPFKKLVKTPTLNRILKSKNPNQQETGSDSDGKDYFEDIMPDGYYYLNKLRHGEIIGNNMIDIFSGCATTDIVQSILDLLINTPSQEMGNVTINSLFEYDAKYNGLLVWKSFINVGGLPYILSNEQIISTIFLNLKNDEKQLNYFTKLLIECGIMNNKNINNFLLNSMLYFELIYKYLEYSSIKFWYNWCSRELNLTFLCENLADKKAQSILIKLASFDSSSGALNNHWVFEKLLPILPKVKLLDEETNTQVLYIVLKTLTYLLQLPEYALKASSSNIYSYSSTSPNNSPSPTGTLLMTPASSMNSPIKHFSSMRKPSGFNKLPGLKGKSLPPEFLAWLLGYLEGGQLMTINNIHVWKYFAKVCFGISKIDSNILMLLYENDNFYSLFNDILLQYGKPGKKNSRDSRNLKSILLTVQQILSDISKSPDIPTSQYKMHFFRLVISFLREPTHTFISWSIEIILNISQNSNFTQDDVSVFSVDDIGNAFYNFSPNDIHFSTLITRYTKLFSFGQFSDACGYILKEGHFLERIMLFFKLYENSLLIQIDLLKLIKIIFYCTDKKEYETILLDTTAFLVHNWDASNNSNRERQVGKDSVLIAQLCSDISNLANST